MQSLPFERMLTELDHVRLSNLVRRDMRTDDAQAQTQATQDTLDASALVPSRRVSPGVVTTYSQVLLEDRQTHQRSKWTLCCPANAEPALGFVSVLSPVGSSLLGLQVGSIAHWSTPAGDARSAEVMAILFQPESGGDCAL